jgi:thiamine-phosphate pyrophosphorylase
LIPRLWYWSDGERGRSGRDQCQVIERLWRGGVEAIVLRERELSGRDWSRQVETLAPLRAQGLKVLVSRRLDVALALGLDGVQLGREATPVAEARALLGPKPWIGYSAHEPDVARAAAKAGASFVTLSPVYATSSKPGAPPRGVDWLRAGVAQLAIPVLALGGVTAARVAEVTRAGAHGVVAVEALGAAPDPEAAAREFSRALADEGDT